MHYKKNTRLFGSLFTIQTLLIFSQFADEVNDKSIEDEDIYYLEPITVTAEKRPSELQKTPMSVSAFSKGDIKNYQIDQVTDLSLITPGLFIGNNNSISTPEIYIRGVGTTNISSGSDLSVSLYVDEVYISRAEAMFTDLFDLERIEVLRGPQGTLYGRNTTGGAIRLITALPSPELTTSHQLTYGNFDLLNINGTISGPIIEDTILGKITYSYRDRDGYTKNVLRDKRLNDADSFNLRGSLRVIPSDNLDIILNADYTRDRTSGFAFKPLQTGMPILGGAVGPVTMQSLGHIEPGDTYKVNQDADSKNDRDTYGISARLTLTLDSLTVESISAIRGLEFDVPVNDVDGSSLQLFNFSRDMEHNQYSQEFRLYNPAEARFKWIFGAFFFAEEIDDIAATENQDLNREEVGLQAFFGTIDYSATNFADVNSYSYALYGQASYEVTKRFSSTLGLRFTHEEKKLTNSRISNVPSFIPGFDPSFPRMAREEEWNAFTPKLGFQFELTKDIMIYGNVSRGFKSGGFNSLQTQPEEPFDPEFIIAYEAGLKSIWLDKRFQFDAAAYYYDYTDLQVQQTIGPRVVTTNAADARSYGFEIELAGRPGSKLDIFANVSILSTEYRDFVNVSGIDVSGKSLIRSPEFSSSVAVQYTIPAFQSSSFIIRAEHQYQSRFYFTETNERILSQPDFHNLNARIAYKSKDSHYSFAFFGRNLTDEETINVAFDFRNELGAVIRSFNPPREYGFELICHF